MAFADVNGEQLFFDRRGNGPAVILVHSLGTSSSIWQSLMQHLESSFECIAFDCRGHGRSSRNRVFSVEAIADDILALASVLDRPRFHLVGISMGGVICMTAYAKSPDRVSSLVLADSYASSPAGAQDRIANTRKVLATTPMRKFAADYVASTLMTITADAVKAEVTSVIEQVSPEAYLETLEAILTVDRAAGLSRIAVPTLVVVGEHDQRTPVAVSRGLVAAIPGARLQVIDGAGHLANLDQPDAFNGAVSEFLTSVERTDHGS